MWHLSQNMVWNAQNVIRKCDIAVEREFLRFPCVTLSTSGKVRPSSDFPIDSTDFICVTRYDLALTTDHTITLGAGWSACIFEPLFSTRYTQNGLYIQDKLKGCTQNGLYLQNKLKKCTHNGLYIQEKLRVQNRRVAIAHDNLGSTDLTLPPTWMSRFLGYPKVLSNAVPQVSSRSGDYADYFQTDWDWPWWSGWNLP